MNEETFLTIDELSARLKMKKSWLYTRTRETGPGSIPRRKAGKYLLFVWDEVKPWIDKHYGINVAGGRNE